ncbi:MAG: hypothetical protein IKH09_09845 [Clostridia bacterium]|nr:hypothetical protein [Clostridia bacterium]
MAKKILILLLVLTLVLPVAVSCGNGGGSETGKETASDTAGTGENENEYAELDAYVEELAEGTNTDGSTFTYIGRSSDNFPKEERELGDIQSDAVYYRQRDLEEIFGIDWEAVITDGGPTTTDQVTNEVTAGGDSYDLVYGNVITVSQYLFNSGVIRRVDTLDTINLDKEWWVQSLRDVYSIKGKLFFLRGYATVESFQDTDCVLFNKTVASMFDGIDEDELYSLARDGKWTIDEMQRVASYVPENPTGTGIYRYDNADAIGLLFSSGLKITNFDEEGAPYIVDALPVEFLDLSQITVGMFADNSQTPTADYRKGEDKMTKYGVDEDYDWFQDNKALFQFSGTGGAISLRQFDVVFGILPMPKGSASQAQYYSYADPWGSGSLTIPKTTKNIDVTSTITEAMGALSAKYVKTAYYDMLLRGQSIFDMESRDMLDIIFQTTVYDMVDIYSGGDVNQWGPLMQALSYDMTYDNTSITSNWKSNVKVTKYTIKNIIKTADNQD